MISKFFNFNKRLFGVFTIFAALIASLLVIIIASGFTAYGASNQQVDYAGSETWQAGEGELGFRQLMTQTKDALGNDIENTFDVELGIRSKTDLSYKNIHICLVLDLSRSMLANVGTGTETTTRLDALSVAAHDLINKYVIQSENVPLPSEEGGVKRSLSIIGFNTSAHVLLSTQDVRLIDEEEIYNQFWENLKTSVSSYATYNSSIDKFEDAQYGYCSPERFTNCESGLRTAQYYVDSDLAGLDNVSKNILFLSDGLPTTYSVIPDHSVTPSASTLSYDEKGFYNYMSDASEHGIKLNPDWSKSCWYLDDRTQSSLTVGNDGYFANRKQSDLKCTSGVSYSDKSALYAHERAKAMKSAGYKIYSVGIGISAQTIPSSMGSSIVDCYSGDFHGRPYVTCNDLAEFRSWLGGSDSRSGYESAYGIGSSGSVKQSYWDVEDSSGKEKLVEAFDSILKSMVFLTEAWQSHIDIGTDETSSFSDFISLYQYNATTGSWDLTSNPNISSGKYEAGKQGINSAKFNKKINDDRTNAGSLTWDLSNSGYAIEDGYFVYKLKYRIRINNQKTGFQAWDSGNSVKTNEIISVKYQILDQYEQVVPEIKTLYQNTDSIPRFHAFKGDSSTLIKMDLVTREKLSDVTFKLIHKHDVTKATLQDHYCEQCFNNKTAADDEDVYCTATTSSEEGHEGEITFMDIPSGHDYQLIEDEASTPEGYYFPYDIIAKVNFGEVKFYEKKGLITREITEEIFNNPTDLQKIYAPGTDVTSEETMVAPDIEGLYDHIQYVVYWQNNVDSSTDDTVVVTDTLTKGLVFDSQVDPDTPTPAVSTDAATGITTLTWTINNTKYLDAGIFNYKCKVTQDCYNQNIVANTAYQKIGDNPKEFIGTLSNPVPDKEPEEYIINSQTGDISLVVIVSLFVISLFTLIITVRKVNN